MEIKFPFVSRVVKTLTETPFIALSSTFFSAPENGKLFQILNQKHLIWMQKQLPICLVHTRCILRLDPQNQTSTLCCECHNLAYRPPSCIRLLWSPSSTTLPFSRTKIWSASTTVERRWAMQMDVLPSVALFNAAMMLCGRSGLATLTAKETSGVVGWGAGP